MEPMKAKPSPYKIVGAKHGYLTGAVQGLALLHHLPVKFELDEDGNVAASFLLTFSEGPLGGQTVRLLLEPPQEEP